VNDLAQYPKVCSGGRHSFQSFPLNNACHTRGGHAKLYKSYTTMNNIVISHHRGHSRVAPTMVPPRQEGTLQARSH